MTDQTATEDYTLTDRIRGALAVAGFGPNTSKAAASIAAAAVQFYGPTDQPARPELQPNDGIDQGVSRLTLLGLLAGDEIDDGRIERTPSGISFLYRGQRVSIDPMHKVRQDSTVFAEVRLLHSLVAGGARYAVWTVPQAGNVAHVVSTLRDLDAIIDAERAEVFA